MAKKWADFPYADKAYEYTAADIKKSWDHSKAWVEGADVETQTQKSAIEESDGRRRDTTDLVKCTA